MKKYTRRKKILLKVNGNKDKAFLKNKGFLLKMMEIGKKWTKRMKNQKRLNNNEPDNDIDRFYFIILKENIPLPIPLPLTRTLKHVVN